MDVPPEGTAIQNAKAGGSHVQTSSQVEHDEAMGQGGHLEGHLPHIIFTEMAALYSFSYRIRHQVGGWGAAGLEVLRKAASAFARLEEHEFEEWWILKGVIQIDLRHLREPLLKFAGEAFAGEPSS